MPSLDWNLKVWDKSYAWPKDGDEWFEMAAYCGVPYEKWKDQLVRTFMVPHLRPQHTALEIGPGHGRWSVELRKRVPSGVLHLADLSPSCLAFCAQRLAGSPNAMNYHVTDGKSLPAIDTASVDFVWSFDVFVHIDEAEVRGYAKELQRVMKPQSIGVIHHPGDPTAAQRAGGMRSAVTTRMFSEILAKNSLHVIRQTDQWGDNNACNVKLSGDMITVFARP
jgi:ubiquinone/menaquinone biosynthesis C-methylase UbiE